MLDQPPVNDEETEAVNPAANQELLVQKWSIMWRSIIQSALPTSKTILPYFSYLRQLNLRDLDNLLYDGKFRGSVEKFVRQLRHTHRLLIHSQQLLWWGHGQVSHNYKNAGKASELHEVGDPTDRGGYRLRYAGYTYQGLDWSLTRSSHRAQNTPS